MTPPSLIEHNGKRILRFNFSGFSPAEVVAYMDYAKPFIAAEPPQSVRALSIVDIHITDSVVAALKKFAVHNAPFIRASAIVGATPFQRSAIGLVFQSQGRQNIEMFDDEEQAKDWLATK